MATTQFFPINSPLINYYFYAAPLSQGGPNVPLNGGTLNFFADEDHSLQLPTYSDVFDPDNLVVNPNPIELGQAGDCPPFYLENRLYFIQIKDILGNVVATIEHYNPADNSGSVVSGENGNILANGQFTYPIDFSQVSSTPGLAVLEQEAIAWAWVFTQDTNTDTKNIITFNNVASEGIEGNPIFELELLSIPDASGELQKDFVQAIGAVNYLSGQDLTFSFQARSLLGETEISLILEQSFGDDGAESVFTTIEVFTVTAERTKYIKSFTVPSVSGITIGPNNYVALHLQGALGQICNFAFTNALLLQGVVSDPTYNPDSLSNEVAQIIGNATVIQDAGLPQNYSNYMYDDGKIFPYADTGTIVLCPKGSVQPFRVPCDGSSLLVSDYNDNNIPFARLFNVIGTTYGGSGSLVVSSEDNKAIFSSGLGARENSAYIAGTSGFIVSNTIIGLRLGVSAEVINSNTIQLTWVGDFAPSQVTPASPGLGKPPNGLVGNWFFNTAGFPNPITVTAVNPGSGADQAVANITFTNPDVSAYSSQLVSTTTGGTRTLRFFEFATFANNARGSYGAFNSLVIFQFNGGYSSNLGTASSNILYVNFLSVNSLLQNLHVFADGLNNPFEWRYTINSLPSLQGSDGPWMGFSSSTTDYYLFFKINGVGDDPAPAGRTNILGSGESIGLSTSSDTPETTARKIALAVNDLTFNTPDSSVLPAIPEGGLDLSQWYINL